MSERPRRLAVVLFNLGGPDSLKAVRPFLYNLFSDPAIIGLPALARRPLAALIAGLRARSARANYAHMGGASPLGPETQAQADALQAALEGGGDGWEARVFVAMRYWRPSIEAAATAVATFAPDDVVLLPLYPQFSTTTTGSSLAAWEAAYRGPGRTHAACCYFGQEGLVEAHARRILECWRAAGEPAGMRLLFSAHGLPQRVVAAGDPYPWQVEETCRAIVARLPGAWDWKVCYQSRVGPLKWTGPSTLEAIAEACQDGLGVMIDPVAFVSEHVETLVELDRDYAALAERAGCHPYLRVRTVGVEPAFIEGLGGVVRAALSRPGTGPAGEACPGRFGQCPRRRAIKEAA